jgi:hypothetical protein
MSITRRLVLLVGLCVFLLVTLLGVGVAQANAATISGTVTDDTFTVPLSNVQIELCGAAGNYLESVQTNATGLYSFTGVAAGSYLVRAIATYQNYISKWYPNVTYQGNWTGTGALPVDVTTLDVSGISFALPPGQTISGTLEDASSNPISNGSVRLHDTAGHYLNIDANTDDNGAYSLVGIVPGVYKVLTWSSYKGYIDEWYSNVNPNVVYQDNSAGTGATSVDVTAGNASGIDFALNQGQSISGTVTDASTNLPIPMPGLVLISATDAAGWKATVAVDNTYGSYSIGGLRPGSYKLSSWNDQGYIDQWYQSIPFEGNPSGAGATLVDASTGDVIGINFSLSAKTLPAMFHDLGSFITNPAAGVDPKIATSLTADVNAALAALAKGNKNANKVAVNNLNALINHVNAQAGKKISSNAAQAIIAQARAIIAAINM